MTAAAPSADSYPSAPRFSAGWMAGIVAVHAALLVLLTLSKAPPIAAPTPTLMVHIVAAAHAPSAHITPPQAPASSQQAPAKALPISLPISRQPSPQRAAQTPSTAVASETAPAAATTPAAAASHNAPVAAASVTQARFDAAYLHNPAPLYPALSRRLGEEGKVLLHVHVDASGRAQQIEIRHSSSWPRLDQSALAAVARWKFIAARRGDEAVDAWVLVPIVFNLNN